MVTRIIENPEMSGTIGLIEKVETDYLRTTVHFKTIEGEKIILSSNHPEIEFGKGNEDLIIAKEEKHPIIIAGNRISIMDDIDWEKIKSIRLLDRHPDEADN